MRIGAFNLPDPVPELHDTCAIAMLRPWIDVGKVGTLVLNHLADYLSAKELGRLARPGTFFDFTRYRPRTTTVDGRRALTTPNSVARYGHDAESNRDYILLNLREPHAMAEDYADSIVALLRHFNVTEYCRIGGMYDSVPHTRPLLVTGTLSDAQIELANGLVSPQRNTYQGPTSIVNLVTEALAHSEVATSSLMAHLPQYVQLEEDHAGASRLLEILCAVYKFSPSLNDQTHGQEQYMDISRAVETNPEIKNLITQLETYYDQVLANSSSTEGISFSPEVEKFLREMGERLGNLQNSQEDN